MGGFPGDGCARISNRSRFARLRAAERGIQAEGIPCVLRCPPTGPVQSSGLAGGFDGNFWLPTVEMKKEGQVRRDGTLHMLHLCLYHRPGGDASWARQFSDFLRRGGRAAAGFPDGNGDGVSRRDCLGVHRGLWGVPALL